MSAGTIGALVIIAIIAVITIRSMMKRANSGCCGGSDPVKIKKVKVQDKNRDHYAHEAVLKVDGMTCSHCASRVENALNGMDGVYAKVDLSGGKADVLMKELLDEGTIRQAVNDLGPYTVMQISWVK